MHPHCPIQRRRRRRAAGVGVSRLVATVTVLVACTQLTGCADELAAGEFELGANEIASPLPSEPPPKLRSDDLPAGKRTLIFAATPYLGDAGTTEAFDPIAAAVGELLGVEVQFRTANSYAELIERTAKGEYDIIQLSPLSYVLARARVPGLRLVASSLSFGTGSYSSFLVVRGDSDLQSLDDLLPDRRPKGSRPRVALVDERSGSGFLLPYAAFLDHGLDPDRDLDLRFYGGHELAVEAVMRGEADIAGVSSGTLNSVRRGEVIGPGNLRILFKAGRLPYDALCVAPTLSEDVAQRVASAFARINTRDVAGRRALRLARGLTGWIATDDERYDVLRTTLERVRARKWSRWADDLALPSAATATGAAVVPGPGGARDGR